MKLKEHQYVTIEGEVTGEFKDKGSRFVAYASSVSNEEQAHQYLESIRKIHHKARHHCYAFRVGHANDLVERQSDDGEPSGTAGRPILGQLISFDIEFCIVVVVRYFGGVKLGTSGLIKAYRQATKVALDNAELVTKEILETYLVDTDYTCSHHFMDACKKMEIVVRDQQFDARAKFIIALPPQIASEQLLQLKSLTLQIPFEMAEIEKSEAWQVTPIDLY